MFKKLKKIMIATASNILIKREPDKFILEVPYSENNEILERIIDYLEGYLILSKSKATEKDIDDISEEINRSWWEKNKKFKAPALS